MHTNVQIRMEADIWVLGTGFGVEFALAIGLVCWVLKKTTVPSWLKANGKKTPTPVCKSEVCAKLNDCMVSYMKKHLAFEDETEELEEVKKQLLDQINIHSTDEMTCVCGPHTLDRLLRRPLPEQTCQAGDLTTCSDVAKKCGQLWPVRGPHAK